MLSIHFDDVLFIPKICTFDVQTIAINIWYNKYLSCLCVNFEDYGVRDITYTLYFDLLFCHEIKTVFITNVRGIEIGITVEDNVLFTLEIYKNHDIISNEIKEIINKMYGYKLMIYNKGYFMNIQNQFKANIALNCSTLSNIFSQDIIDIIREKMSPEWLKYRRIYIKNKCSEYFQNIVNFENGHYIEDCKFKKYESYIATFARITGADIK